LGVCEKKRAKIPTICEKYLGFTKEKEKEKEKPQATTQKHLTTDSLRAHNSLLIVANIKSY